MDFLLIFLKLIFDEQLVESLKSKSKSFVKEKNKSLHHHFIDFFRIGYDDNKNNVRTRGFFSSVCIDIDKNQFDIQLELSYFKVFVYAAQLTVV